MPYKIRCNPMLSLYDALPEPYMPVRVTRGAVIAHRNTNALRRSRASQYRKTFIFLSVSMWNDIGALYPYSKCWTRRFQEQGQCLFIGLAARSLFCLLSLSISFLSFYELVLWGWGLRSDRVLIALSPTLSLSAFFNNNNNNNNSCWQYTLCTSILPWTADRITKY